MPDYPFDAAHELQAPVEPLSPLAEALQRAGVVGSTRDELMAATGLTAALVDKIAQEVREADGRSGMLVYRLRAAALAAQAVAKARAKAVQAPSTWEALAMAQTEARLGQAHDYERDQATAREQLEMINPAERTRCCELVLTESPWLRRIGKSQDPLENRVLGALTLTYWRRHGRTTV